MKKIFFSILLLSPFFIAAQTEADIRKHYAEVNKQITESIEHGYEGSLYNNHWVTNKNAKSWPAVGNYSEITDFWYDDPPDHLSASDRNPKTVLLKVTVSRKAAVYSASEEYVYKDGKLLFYYSNEGEEDKQWETRVYFNSKGIMFKSSVKADGKELTAKDFLTEEYKDFKPIAATVMASGKKYQDLFVKSMM
jgi:uncharacterized protein (DUF2147 family)